MFCRLFVLFVFLCCSSSQAHDVFTGEAKAVITEKGTLLFEVGLASVTTASFTEDIINRNNQINHANLPNIKDHLANKAKNFFKVTLDGKTINSVKIDIHLDGPKDDVVFTMFYKEPIKGVLGFKSDFIDFTNPEYTMTLSVFDANQTQLGLFIHTFDHRYDEILIDGSAAKPNSDGVFASFFELGIHHIVIGFDHLLFLLGLLVVCRNWKHAAIIVTCFTLAHTITLSLAALNIVDFSAKWVEILIAFTIVYIGAENLYFKHKPKHRWLLTSSFGLIHGLGFANVLLGLGLGTAGAPVFVPLLAFNLGVEVGQLSLAAITLPILWYLLRFKWYEQKVLPVISSAIVFIGLFWVYERLI